MESAASSTRFAERYELHELLGRGGMASVYRATDLSSGRVVALKQLIAPERDEQRAAVELWFEREFHTLSQLSHPRVIAVYDYGITPEGVSYYTMELLDGGDLRERAPLPWREACRLSFDVCSSLALLHSRRLLHRDISPRNIRCTRDGAAKLIDFGAMAPMSGGGSPLVGTPAFTAPETVHRSAIDARTDLYALGASLYYALTGKLAYPARAFAELFAAWNERPLPPSAYEPTIPAALDGLVLSLLSVEPALRPPSAFEVMQRLAAIADLPREESKGVASAYLATPALVGRDRLVATLRDKLGRALTIGGNGVMIRAEAGLGRSRVLDACALEAKTLGARVIRAAARGKPQGFEVAWELARHLLEALPSEALAAQLPQLFHGRELRPMAELQADPEQLQQDLARLFRAASKSQALVVAVDDVHRIDEPSAAVVAALIDRARQGRAFVALTCEASDDASNQALDVLTRRCDVLALAPLREDETLTLFGSVFGDVPNLSRLTEEIFALARGNPRLSIELAQHLIDRGLITYAAGTWTLPSDLSAGDLPRSADAVIQARIAGLRPLARTLAETQAVSFEERWTDEHYRALAGAAPVSEIDAAMNELVSQQIVVGDGQSYVLANRAYRAALEPRSSQAHHRALAAFYKPNRGFPWIHHALCAGGSEEVEALDELFARQHDSEGIDHRQLIEQEFGRLGPSYQRAIALAEKLGRPRRQVFELRRWFAATNLAAGRPEYFWLATPPLREQLIHDTGLDLYRLDADNADTGARLGQALTKAMERHSALPEHERVYRLDEALPRLAEYVALAIAFGVRTLDVQLVRGLPALLEPFAPLSPLMAALWQNAVCTNECYEYCHYELARERWKEVHAQLKDVTGDDARYASAIRNAVAYAVGILEAAFGMPSAASWADDLEDDPYQRVSALYLRKIVRLEQGDWTGADKLQRQAEVLALRMRVPPMFTTSLTVEISAHAHARDLAGVKDVIERERVEAARYPGWIPYLREAEARFELIRGNYAHAKQLYELLITDTAVDHSDHSPSLPVWVFAQTGLCESLLGLDRAGDVRAAGVAALAICERLQVRQHSYDLVRVVALAEAKLGDYASAIARLDRVLADQTALGVTGLRIGLTYEARAEIALWSGDAAAFAKYASLTAREYRHGARCPLGVCYERLIQEARCRGLRPIATLSDFEPTTIADSSLSGMAPDLNETVRLALHADDAADRYLKALRLVCAARSARGGHLYLPANDGLKLVASCDLGAPPAGLSARVQEYVHEEEDRFDTMTIAIAADDRTALEQTSSSPIERVQGTDYELLLLTHVRGHESQIAGVIAIAPGERTQPNPRQTLLLSAIAAEISKAAAG